MGRYFYNKKSTVNQYISIHVKKLKEWGFFKQGFKSGTFVWRSSRSGEKKGIIDAYISISGNEGTMRLVYAYEKTEHLNYEVQLISTPCNYGGFRWWFLCPLMNCGKRVGVLYIGKYARCRHCYDLTYESCQDSHKFDLLARSMGFPNETVFKRVLRLEAKWKDY